MAGGRAGVKKMMGGGRAGMKKAAKSIGPGESALIKKLAEKELRKMIGKAGKTISNKDKKIVAKAMMVGGKAKKEKMYDVEVDGKMYKFGFDSKPTSAALKKAAKALGPKKRKSVKEVAKEINAQKKKMGGRAGVVKMMNGGDPLSKRGIKMGMSMSPSKNKGKGLYGK